ncbi:MAG: histidine kinase [Naasia sp.]
MSTSESAPAVRGLYGWVASHPRAVDRTIATVLLVITVLPYLGITVVAFLTDSDPWPTALLLAVSLALAIPLYWRRTRPLATAGVVLAVCLIQLVAGLELVTAQIAALVVISALAGYAPRWASWWGLGLGLAGILAFAIRNWAGSGLTNQVIGAFVLLGFGWSLVGVAWLIGDLTRSRRLERSALADRADRLERERERELLLAAADERTRIARDMHDIVAHSLSIIVTQADGARYAAPASAGPVLPALEAIAETARVSLSEMRRLLGVLRDDDAAPTAPTAGLAEIEALIAGVRESGLPVRWRASGERHRPELPQGAELVIFRAVQESLTNVLKHAGPGARADVELTWGPTAVEVRVEDDGRGPDPDSDAAPGHGLQGMRERLALYDGDLRLETPDGGGLRLIATMPYPASAAGTGSPLARETAADTSADLQEGTPATPAPVLPAQDSTTARTGAAR